MTPDTTSPFAFVQQIMLVVFILMILVTLVGGKPDIVLKPLFEIVCSVLMAVINLAVQLLTTLFGTLLSLLLAGIKSLFNSVQSSSSKFSR